MYGAPFRDATPTRIELTKSPKLKVGTYLQIPLADGSFGYGRVLQFPYVAFYDLRTAGPAPGVAQIDARPVLWRLSVRITGGHDRWPKVGHAPLSGAVAGPVTFFTQDDDRIDSCAVYDTEGMSRRVAPEECVGLERSANWDARHVEERLLDHFEGRENESVERLRVKLA
jgi:hypothetical protein